MSESDQNFAPQSGAPLGFAQRFSLLHDKADDDVIDSSLRAGIELRGATAWILMFAILVASIGLNINSPAVIIGAMLISPLMGPIVGIGYGIGIFDFALIRRSLLNLGIAAAISLVTSTLYFVLTPLDEAQSELLARTTPTLWDVLIALTGGLAGIIGMTRREKSNVLPGVAIATALMPPLCTAGYGLANGNWAVFGGAFYLFSINCVFIAVATVIVIEFLRLPHRKFVDQRVERRVKRTLLMVVMLTGLPSIYLAIQLVDNEVFGHRARQFVREEFSGGATHVVDTRLSPMQRRIELTLIGARMPATAIAAIEKRLPHAGLEGASLVVHQAEDSRVDVGVLKADILAEIYRDTQEGLRERDATIARLQQELAQRDAKRDAWRDTATDIAAEFAAQYPNCGEVLMGVALVPGAEGKAPTEVSTLTARCKRNLAQADVRRAEAWLVARTKSPDARLVLVPPARGR